MRIAPGAWTGAQERDVSRAIAWSRREFLRAAAGVGSATALHGFRPMYGLTQPRPPKAVVVTFGGGARDEETFAPEGQENIPRILAELIPQATFFTQVVNRGILGHYVATASIATGVYETLNNFASLPPGNPTIFEYFRRDLGRPASDAWVVAPSNGFNRIGESSNKVYGAGSGAGVILPKQLLNTVVSPGASGGFAHLLHDNYEAPLYTPELGGHDFSVEQLESLLKLSVSDFTAHARSVLSPDELSVFIARRLMGQLAPSLLWITLHDIDIAHSGSYSLYVDGIRRSDRLCAEIWKEIQTNPEYAGRTTLYILPDFGRDADTDAGGNGFQHHRTGDPLSRTTWMMVLGPGIRQGAVVDRPIEPTDLVPTIGRRLGFSPRFAQGRAIEEIA